MELTDLMPLDRWVELEKEICGDFNIDANVFNVDGIRITNHKEWKNRLCPAIKATDKGQSFICAVAHMNLAIMSQNTRSPVAEECDAGLLKMVVPVFVGDAFLGAVCGCGVLPEGGEADSFLINKITEIDADEVESLAVGIRQISQDEIDSYIAFAERRIKQIVSNYKNSS
jgi:ligand-binding sensor protein